MKNWRPIVAVIVGTVSTVAIPLFVEAGHPGAWSHAAGLLAGAMGGLAAGLLLRKHRESPYVDTIEQLGRDLGRVSPQPTNDRSERHMYQH